MASCPEPEHLRSLTERYRGNQVAEDWPSPVWFGGRIDGVLGPPLSEANKNKGVWWSETISVQCQHDVTSVLTHSQENQGQMDSGYWTGFWGPRALGRGQGCSRNRGSSWVGDTGLGPSALDKHGEQRMFSFPFCCCDTTLTTGELGEDRVSFSV